MLDTGLITGPDNSDSPVRGTVLCVHGNPNWSYMWRGLAKRLTGWRVIAVDALNMGFSERTGQPRRLADHVADLGSVTNALQVKGPVITVAHDWGGPISMGWAQQHVDQMAGVVLMNTGVARPAAAKVPALISIARATLRVTCELTPTFLHGALRMARPQMSRDVYRGYAAPYDSAARRTGIRDFVEDIPIEDTHPSFDSLASVADGLTASCNIFLRCCCGDRRTSSSLTCSCTISWRGFHKQTYIGIPMLATRSWKTPTRWTSSIPG